MEGFIYINFLAISQFQALPNSVSVEHVAFHQSRISSLSFLIGQTFMSLVFLVGTREVIIS